MKKMFKTAASLAVGCALLSTSAFAALEGSVVKTETGATVSLTGYAEKAQSTILVLKDVSELSADLADSAIAYINQAEATDGSIAYDVKVSGDGTYTVFVGGSDQTEAKNLGSFVISSVPEEPEVPALPEGTAILVRNADPYGLTGYSVVKVTGIDAGSVAIKDADGNEVAAYLADYTDKDGARQYLAIVKGTEFTLDSIVYDATATAETLEFGNVNGDEFVNGSDGSLISQSAVNLVTLDNKNLIAADVNIDGIVNGSDSSLISQKAVNLVNMFEAAK